MVYVLNRSAIAGVLIAALAFGAASLQCAWAETPPAVSPGGPLTVVVPPDGSMPDTYKLNMMIRTTLIALNQANQTGNYSVLRDLGTPQFQAMNSDAQLAVIFAALRQRNLDLSPLLFFDPQLARQPTIEPGGVLRLAGLIPTTPERILFDMGFERIGDQWRLSAIVIDVQQAPESMPAKQSDKATPKPDAKADAKAKPKPKTEKAPAPAP